MDNELKELDEKEVEKIIARRKLIDKWIIARKKEKVLVNIADIYLLEKIHRGRFDKRGMANKRKKLEKTIIVRPWIGHEGKYLLVIGWSTYHIAQIIGWEKVYAYITHTGRKRFAQKLLKYEFENTRE